MQSIADDIRAADVRRDAAWVWRQFAFSMLSAKGKAEWRAVAARVMGLADGLNRQFKDNPRRQTKPRFENDVLSLEKAPWPMVTVEARPVFDAGVIHFDIKTRRSHGSREARSTVQLSVTYEEDNCIHITLDGNEVSDVEELLFDPIRKAVKETE